MTRLKSNEIAVPWREYERMKTALQRSGWQQYTALGEISHYDHMDEFVQAALTSAGSVLDALDEVIDALGLRDSYKDFTTTETAVDFGPCPPYQLTRMVKHTDRGAQRFLADIRAAKSAKDSEAAVARLTAALKQAR